LTADHAAGSSRLVPEATVLDILNRYGAHFPYGAFRLDASEDGGWLLPIPRKNSLVRFLPSKPEWRLPDMLAFEGVDFVYAVTRALGERVPTDSELSRLSRAGAREKLDFILELNEANKATGRSMVDLRQGRVAIAARLAGWLRHYRIPLLTGMATSYHQRLCAKLYAEAAHASINQRLLYQCLHKIDLLASTLKQRAQGPGRIVIANFYTVWPPVGGGQRRIFFLARELSKAFDVEIVSLARDGTSTILHFSPTLREVQVTADRHYRALEARVDQRVKMAADLAYALHWQHCPTYQSVLAQCLENCDVAVTTHPYSIHAIEAALHGRSIPIVYDSQNCEIEEKQTVLADVPDGLLAIRDVEAAALRSCTMTIACTSLDADSFARHYGADRDAIEIIENGVDAINVPQMQAAYRDRLRNELKLEDRLVTVFGGSFYHPNFSAVDNLLRLAQELPDVTFIVLGTVCDYPPLKTTKLPNVVRLGRVDEDTKWVAYNLADIGLNPMTEGSGTAVKMFEYAAAGLTILSTPWGARGVPLSPDTDFLISEIAHWSGILKAHTDTSHDQRKALGRSAKQRIENVADWSVIGTKYVATFRKLISQARTAPQPTGE
jgi:glycosyltransferase involved in cell wall biosynthesis